MSEATSGTQLTPAPDIASLIRATDFPTALLPRNDVEILKRHTAVVPREGGGSSTPRLIGLIIDVSGILDRPPSRTMTVEYDVRDLAARLRPRFACEFPALLDIRGRREDRVLAAPAVSRAICANKNCTRAYRAAGTLRPSLRNGFTAYFVLFPENGSFASVVPKDFPPTCQHRGVRTTRLRRTHPARTSSRPLRPSHLTARS